MRPRTTRPNLHVIAVIALLAGLTLPLAGAAAAGDDTTPPELGADFAPNDVLPLSPLLTGSATDASGVALVHVAIRDTATLRFYTPDGSTVGGDATIGFPADLSDPNGTDTAWSFDASSLPRGHYMVFVMARDTYGNLAVWHTPDGLKIDVFVGVPDSDLPVLTANFGGTVNPAIEVGGTATDTSGVAAVRVAVRNQGTGLWHLPSGEASERDVPTETLATLGDPRAPSTSWSYNLGLLPPGDYNVLVRGSDIFDNAIWWYSPGMLRVPITVIDEGPPLLTADYTQGAVLSMPLTLTGRVADPTGVAEVLVAIRDKATLLWQLPNGDTMSGIETVGFPAEFDEPLGTDTAWSFAAPAVGPGFYEVFVMAYDLEGNYSLWHTNDGLRHSIYVGTPEFELPVVTADFEQGAVIPSGATLTGRATDESGVAAVRIAVRNQETGLFHLPGGETGSFNNSILATIADPRAPETAWSYDPGPLPAGPYNVIVKATDIYGNAIWWWMPGCLRIGVTVVPATSPT